MAKSLSERIAERMSTTQPTQAGKNRAAFLAVRDEVKKALDDGWPVKVVWATLRDEGRVEFKYDAFIKYVNQLVRNAEPPARPTAPAAQTTATPTPKAATRSASSSPTTVPAVTPKPAVPAPASPASEQAGKIPSFNFNPTPNKEDLL
ncbi:TraK family protein [Pseudomonas aeruginosa]|uniref:TraK family protein n=1 Tax=Pseudomonas aeruginosa TaxID=287 RepID=UPI003B67E792|nr:TraK family protein [Enterobacter hormaechei subsp. steigerwaltii]HCR1388191.1 TraK family protein [Pseudomonas aeruginosa]